MRIFALFENNRCTRSQTRVRKLLGVAGLAALDAEELKRRTLLDAEERERTALLMEDADDDCASDACRTHIVPVESFE